MSHIPYYKQESVKTRVEHNKFTDEYFIVIPDDIIQLLNLITGDTIAWSEDSNKVLFGKETLND